MDNLEPNKTSYKASRKYTRDSLANGKWWQQPKLLLTYWLILSTVGGAFELSQIHKSNSGHLIEERQMLQQEIALAKARLEILYEQSEMLQQESAFLARNVKPQVASDDCKDLSQIVRHQAEFFTKLHADANINSSSPLIH